MDDDEFEDYVGSQEVVEENKQQQNGQECQQPIKESIVENKEAHSENVHEMMDNEQSNVVDIGNEHLVNQVESNIKEVITNDQVQPKIYQQHYQYQETIRPYQLPAYNDHQSLIQTDLLPLNDIKTILLQTQINHLNHQPLTPFVETQSNHFNHDQPSEILQNKQENQIQTIVFNSQVNNINCFKGIEHQDSCLKDQFTYNRDNLLIMDQNNMINENPISRLQDVLESHTTTIVDNQHQIPAINGQNVLPEEYKVESNPDIYLRTSDNPDIDVGMLTSDTDVNFGTLNPDISIGTLNFDNLMTVNQASSIDPFQHPQQLPYSTQQEPLPIEPQKFENEEIINIQETKQLNAQSNLILASNQEVNQQENNQIHQHQGQSQQDDDEFGDFETYQQSNQQIPNIQTVKIHQQTENTAQEEVSQSYNQADTFNQQTKSDYLTRNSYENQYLSHQNQSNTEQINLEVYSAQQYQINRQIPHEQYVSEQHQPNSQTQPIQPEIIKTNQPQIQIVPQKMTLQDQLEAFINSLPNYKRICQRTFIETG